MDKKDQAREYRKLMGDEAANRQEQEAERCTYCLARPGELHLPYCRRGRGRRVAKRANKRGLTRD